MTMPNIRELENDVLRAEGEVARMERVYGKNSPEYHNALKQLARIWSVLRLNRGREDFLKELG